jgi:hypothetical protein
MSGQQYRQRIMHDATQQYEVNESIPWFLSIDNESEGTISTRVKLLENVAIDFICDAISIIALIDNPDNPGVGDLVPTSQVKVNIRDTLSQEGWIFTAGGALAQMTPIPISLFAGMKPSPLPTPRPLYQNSQIELVVEPCGVEICYFSMTFFGRRLDTLASWERDKYCADPRTSGAYWIYCGPSTIERADTVANPCTRGPVTQDTIRIPNQPFDAFVTGISGILTDPSNDALPLGRGLFEFKLTDLNTKHSLAQKWISSSMLGGSMMYSHGLFPETTLPCDQELVTICCPRSMPLYGAWRIRSQSAIECRLRMVWSPLDRTLFPTANVQLLLHGMRVPSDEIAAGFPYYNRNDGSLRCPSGSNGVPPGSSSGTPQWQQHPQMLPQQQRQLPKPPQGYGFGR